MITATCTGTPADFSYNMLTQPEESLFPLQVQEFEQITPAERWNKMSLQFIKEIKKNTLTAYSLIGVINTIGCGVIGTSAALFYLTIPDPAPSQTSFPLPSPLSLFGFAGMVTGLVIPFFSSIGVHQRFSEKTGNPEFAKKEYINACRKWIESFPESYPQETLPVPNKAMVKTGFISEKIFLQYEEIYQSYKNAYRSALKLGDENLTIKENNDRLQWNMTWKDSKKILLDDIPYFPEIPQNDILLETLV